MSGSSNPARTIFFLYSFLFKWIIHSFSFQKTNLYQSESTQISRKSKRSLRSPKRATKKLKYVVPLFSSLLSLFHLLSLPHKTNLPIKVDAEAKKSPEKKQASEEKQTPDKRKTPEKNKTPSKSPKSTPKKK